MQEFNTKHSNFISIHAPREGGDDKNKSNTKHQRISIHAPREGGDLFLVLCMILLVDFNPRPPRGGRRGRIVAFIPHWAFQSTPPARGATT